VIVRRRRRELGLAVPAEERVLSFRSQPSESLPVINQELEKPRVGHTLSLLRTERCLEELDAASQKARGQDVPVRTRQCLEKAVEQELHTYQALIAPQAGEDA